MNDNNQSDNIEDVVETVVEDAREEVETLFKKPGKKEKADKKEKKPKLTRRELKAIKGEIGQSAFRRLYGKL
jgi:hypothetical protein